MLAVSGWGVAAQWVASVALLGALVLGGLAVLTLGRPATRQRGWLRSWTGLTIAGAVLVAVWLLTLPG